MCFSIVNEKPRTGRTEDDVLCNTQSVQSMSKGGGANTGRSGLGKEGSYVKIKSWGRRCGKTGRNAQKNIQ